jgi:hypothetical protein
MINKSPTKAKREALTMEVSVAELTTQRPIPSKEEDKDQGLLPSQDPQPW